MFFDPRKTTSPLTVDSALELVKDLRDAEIIRDIDTSRRILEPFWSKFEEELVLPEGLPQEIQAELYRLGGFFLSNLGQAKVLTEFQQRGQNLLIRAIEIFESLNLPEKAAEANIILALCYFYEGRISNSDLILSTLELEYKETPYHPIYLRICMNRILGMYSQKRYKEVLKMIDELKGSMEYCSDDRLKTMYHNQAGTSSRALGFKEQALSHYQLALKSARRHNNLRFEGFNLNNLANLYKDFRKFELAHAHVQDSLQIFENLKEYGWSAHVLDTEALIFFAEGKYQQALWSITSSVEIFRHGEDFAGLTESLFNRVKINIQLENIQEALLDYAELIKIAVEKLDADAVQRYTDEFKTLIYFPKTTKLIDSEREFRKFLIVRSLVKNNFKIGKSAVELGLKDHRALSQILGDQFPELYEELDFARRVRRPKKELKESVGGDAQEVRTVKLPLSHIKKEKPKAKFITRFLSENRTFSFPFVIETENPEIYYCDGMGEFGIPNDSLVAVVPYADMVVGNVLIVSNESKFVLGKIEYDREMNFYFVFDEQKNPIIIDQINLIGQPVGWCPFDEAESRILEFHKLP